MKRWDFNQQLGSALRNVAQKCAVEAEARRKVGVLKSIVRTADERAITGGPQISRQTVVLAQQGLISARASLETAGSALDAAIMEATDLIYDVLHEASTP